VTRHSHEDALSESEFKRLFGGAKLLKPPWNLEAMFIVFAGGRLGLQTVTRTRGVLVARQTQSGDREGIRQLLN